MTRASFRPHERMDDPRDFRRAFARRRSVSDESLIVYAEWNGLPFARLGISVGKKKVKTAVGRNRIKRLLREAFRLNKAAIPAGIDVVIVPRGPRLNFEIAMVSVPRLAQAAARRLPPGPSPTGS